MDRGERRNKWKDKKQEKKKHPYKLGGRFRSSDIKSQSFSEGKN